MSIHLLWKAFHEDDFEQFRHLLERAGTPAQPAAHVGFGRSRKPSASISPGHSSLNLASALGPSSAGYYGKSPRSLKTYHHASLKTKESTTLPAFTRSEINWTSATGVSLLHHVASLENEQASEYANAMLEHLNQLDLYAQDDESGWTALHRALYSGNVTIARALMAHDSIHAMVMTPSPGAQAHHGTGPGGLIKIKDREGFSPFDLYASSVSVKSDRISSQQIHVKSKDAVEVSLDDEDEEHLPPTFSCVEGDEIFTFGSNINFSLGLGDEDDRQYPERVTLARPASLLTRFIDEHTTSKHEKLKSMNHAPAVPQNLQKSTCQPFGAFETPAVVRYKSIIVQDAQMSKLSSAILTTDPEANLYMCGFGSGGRLGTGDETTRFSFVNISKGGLAGKRIAQVALGQNHTIALTFAGETFSWGENLFGQLGYAPASTGASSKDKMPTQLLPRQVFGPLKREKAVQAAASSIHTAVITASTLFTFGKNEGQMGLVDSDARSLVSQSTPRKVGASLFTSGIASVAAIDRATICLLESAEVWVFANYGYMRVMFPVDNFSDSLHAENVSKGLTHDGRISGSSQRQGRGTTLPSFMPSRGNEVSKITAGGDTICTMTALGDVYTMQVGLKSEGATASPSSTTGPSKIRGALSLPHRVWSLKKAHMAVRDVAVGQDGSIIICTASGSVWRRTKRANIRDAGSAARAPQYKTKDYKFSRVPGLTRITTVRSNVFGAFAAIRKDCGIMKTGIAVAPKTLWTDLQALNPLFNFQHDDLPGCAGVAALKHACSTDSDGFEDILRTFLLSASANGSGECDVQLATTASDIRLPAHGFMLAARSPCLRQGLHCFQSTYFYSCNDAYTIEYDKAGHVLITFQDIEVLTLVNIALFIYTDTVVDAWQFTPRQSDTALRYRSVRNELMKFATTLEMRRLEQAVRRMYEPARAMDDDFLAAIADKRFFEDGDISITLENSSVQKVHSALVCRRCPFFEGLFEGRAAGGWLASRRGSNDASGEGSRHDPIIVDLSHVSVETFHLILLHLYSDAGEEIFEDLITPDLDAFLDLIIDVLSLANELMLDRLAQCCQKVLGQHVTMRNVCSLLNAVASCSVTDFKSAALDYICQNLEGLMESRLLDELDDDLMLDLDETVRANQLRCLPLSEGGNVGVELHARYPELRAQSARLKLIQIDRVRLQTRLREKENKLFGAPRAPDDLLEDFDVQQSTAAKSPRISPRDGPTRKSPALKAKDSSADLMFDMDVWDEDSKDSNEIGRSQARRKSSHSHLPIPALPLRESDRDFTSDHTVSTKTPASSSFNRVDDAKDGDDQARDTIKRPWFKDGVGCSLAGKIDMRGIMQQTSSRESTSTGRVIMLESESVGSPRTKLSQRERRKMQQQQREHEESILQQQIEKEKIATNTTTPAPWLNSTSTAKSSRVSLREVMQASATTPPSTPSPNLRSQRPSPSPCSPMTLRQTLSGGKTTQPTPPQSRYPPNSKTATSSPLLQTSPSLTIQSRASASGPATTTTKALQIPSSASTSLNHPTNSSHRASIQPPHSLQRQQAYSIQHIPPSPVPGTSGPHEASSIRDILDQQQTEKDVIREACAKRSLLDIQTEQAFQEWWETETSKIQADQGPCGKSRPAPGRESKPPRRKVRRPAADVGAGGRSGDSKSRASNFGADARTDSVGNGGGKPLRMQKGGCGTRKSPRPVSSIVLPESRSITDRNSVDAAVYGSVR